METAQEIIHQLVTVGEVARFAKCDTATVRNDADAGRLPIAFRTSDGSRLFRPDNAVLYANNRVFKVNLHGFDANSAGKLADAIMKSRDADVAGSFTIVQAFAAACDDAGQRRLAAAIASKMPRPFDPWVHQDATPNVGKVEKLAVKGNK